MNKKKIIEWYENLSQEKRMKLQEKFGNFNILDRETKFYNWLKLNQKKK